MKERRVVVTIGALIAATATGTGCNPDEHAAPGPAISQSRRGLEVAWWERIDIVTTAPSTTTLAPTTSTSATTTTTQPSPSAQSVAEAPTTAATSTSTSTASSTSTSSTTTTVPVQATTWRVPADILFDTDSATIDTAGTERLVALAESELADASKIVVVGHTDSRGSQESNYQLGLDRANAAGDVLVDAGIDPAIVEVDSCGEECPIADEEAEDPEAARSLNRRIEITVTVIASG